MYLERKISRVIHAFAYILIGNVYEHQGKFYTCQNVHDI